MKIESSQDVESFLQMYLASAAVGTALELGLFWLLDKKSLTITEISDQFNIPYGRCLGWLTLLTELGFLESVNNRYSSSSITDNTILKVYTHETWSHLAQEIREGYPAIINLTDNISQQNSVWESQGLKRPNYITLMKNDINRAKRFTRMLFELHNPMAKKLARTLDLTGVKKIMDLGGGSGVVSLALLARYPTLHAVVVDIENVCTVGREIANENQHGDRISYFAADFLQNDIPKGFDMILECDVGVYTKDLFLKIWRSLNEGGKFVIIANTNEQGAWIKCSECKPSLSWYLHSFSSSLDIPRLSSTSTDDIKLHLTNAGFQDISEQVQENNLVIIQASK